MIPRKIFTIWLSSDGTIPPLIQKCIDSQKIPGYEHRVFTLKDIRKFVTPIHIAEALERKEWVRAVDYFRLYVISQRGGIYLDADVEVLPGKNFDDMLDNRIFVSTEPTNFMIANTVIGAEKNNSFLNDLTNKMNNEIKANVFEAGMGTFHELAYHDLMGPNNYGIKVYSPDYFQPYNNQTGEVNITENTRTYHYSTESWKENELPLVSILVPTLGRPEGLQRLKDSIELLNYPKDKIELLIEEDEPIIGVPKRLKSLYDKCHGDYIIYMSNDTEFTPNSVRIAVIQMNSQCLDLVAFNTGEVYPDEGNICEHFMIRRTFVDSRLNGYIFDIDFHHVGVDNLLWAQAKKYATSCGGAIRSKYAIVLHHHFSKTGVSDEVYDLAYSKANEDRELLAKKLEILKTK